MYLVLIAWLYVTFMMAVAEATATNGTVLGAIVTFVMYGLLPMGILGYILGTPGRKRALRARQQAEQDAHAALQAAQPPHAVPAKQPGPQAPIHATAGAPSALPVEPDARGEAPAAAQGCGVPPMRKEP